MKIVRVHLGFLLALLFLSQKAFALIDAQLLLGKRWAEFKTDSATSNVQAIETVVSAHLDPIPLIPVSFGLRLGYQDWNEDDFRGADTITSMDLGVEMMAWLPIVPFVTPYGKAGYSFYTPFVNEYKGSSTIEGQTFESDYKQVYNGTAIHFALGILYPVPVIPLLTFMFELGMSQGTMEVEELESNGAKVTLSSGEASDLDHTSTSASLGLRFHF
jgi:hypothetical protein